MSAESFFNRYKGEFPAEYLRYAIEIKQEELEKKEKHNVSPVHALAQMLIEEGQDGISANQNFQVNGDNYALGIIGISLIQLERSIVDGGFNVDDWVKMHNTFFGGRGGINNIRVDVSVPSIEYIYPSKHEAMVRTAEKDKTLAVFFEKKDLLPDHLYNLLFRFNHVVTYYTEKMLPRYKELSGKWMQSPAAISK
ncbi:hypothetical protein C4559_04890 [Candidatus Microgenomates bacterium]|nr:MAG: hypothetical protein C4559_04890 [Candidatus Microgenomates bacterium]